jgi:hypothetical protein
MAQFWQGHISTADKATPEFRKEFEIFDEQKHPLTVQENFLLLTKLVQIC